MALRPGARLRAFTSRYPWLGPALWVLAVGWFAVQAVVAYEFRSKPPHPIGVDPAHPYSAFDNAISDLGAVTRYTYGSPAIWSPWHVAMNIAFVALGAVMVVGAPLIYTEFTERTEVATWIARVGFSAQGLAGLGSVLVGLFAEDRHPTVHFWGAAFAIAVGTLGITLLGVAVDLPGPLRRYTLTVGPLSLAAIALYALHEYLGFGRGGMERLAAYPEVVWLVAFGLWLGRTRPTSST